MPNIFCDHFKCKSCGDSNCKFFANKIKNKLYFIGKCSVCYREDKKEWRENNKEKMKKLVLDWRKKNKNYVKQYYDEYNKKYYLKNRNKILKKYHMKKEGLL